jgi:hypothetical protein
MMSFALAAVLTLFMGESAEAQCEGCEGTRCLLGCPVTDLTNCGYNCRSTTFPNGGSACVSETGGCGYSLLGADGSVVDPRRVVPAPGSLNASTAPASTSQFQFASFGTARAQQPATDFVLRRPCDGAVVARSYTPAAAERKRIETTRILL